MREILEWLARECDRLTAELEKHDIQIEAIIVVKNEREYTIRRKAFGPPGQRTSNYARHHPHDDTGDIDPLEDNEPCPVNGKWHGYPMSEIDPDYLLWCGTQPWCKHKYPRFWAYVQRRIGTLEATIEQRERDQNLPSAPSVPDQD